MLWTKRQACTVRELPPSSFVIDPDRAALAASKTTPCRGRIEADHMGARGVGQKAGDETVAPMCTGHHGERTDHKATFFFLNQNELRMWRAEAIARNQTAWSQRHG